MKQDFILKTIILFVGLVIVIGVFVGFRVYDQQLAEIEQLQEEVQQQTNQIELLESSNQELDVEVQEDQSTQMQSAVQSFVRALYDVRADNEDMRRSEAELVMSQDMLEQHFPEREGQIQYSMEYRINDMTVYPSVQQESAFVVMTGSTVNLNNNQREDNRITLEVFLQQEGDRWIVTNFDQLHAENL
ncbi:MerR type regulator [Alkalihalophilus lindianensis]|uniref:MerR type regulator n=1 Tax=Alkalihalophilus lindianensis TaxID=1630542 RepID=A0ABU3X9B1_9BACI|nr:MerR type regulator [Alkalihalophilus lindianensis]MDV2684461.1 MerR type regulator [Alkalihalophilus lindianensis]